MRLVISARLFGVPVRWCSTVLLLFLFLAASGCSDSQQPPDFQLNLSPPQIEGTTVTVNGGVVAPVERIQWDWGDGTRDPHCFFPANHTYARPGRYTITVAVFDKNNFSATKSITVDITPE